MREILPVLFAVAALVLAFLFARRRFQPRLPKRQGVSIDFDTYKYREESERQVRNGW